MKERVICSDKIGDQLVSKLADRMTALSAGDESEGHKLPCLFRESSAKVLRGDLRWSGGAELGVQT
jgi:hypothetical protein